MKLYLPLLFFTVAVTTPTSGLEQRNTLTDTASYLKLLIKDIIYLGDFVKSALNCDASSLKSVNNIIKTATTIQQYMFDAKGNVRVSQATMDGLKPKLEKVFTDWKRAANLKGDVHVISNDADTTLLLKNGMTTIFPPNIHGILSPTYRAREGLTLVNDLRYLVPIYTTKVHCDSRSDGLEETLMSSMDTLKNGIRSGSMTHADVDRVKKTLDNITRKIQNALG